MSGSTNGTGRPVTVYPATGAPPRAATTRHASSGWGEAPLDIAGGLSRDERVVVGVADLRRRFPVALLTNNTRALTDRILRKIGFADNAFSAVVSAEDVGAYPKPSPAAFQTVLGQLHVPAAATWSIGDRYDIDIAPLIQLGGAGITISGPDQISSAAAVLVARADVTAS